MNQTRNNILFVVTNKNNERDLNKVSYYLGIEKRRFPENGLLLVTSNLAVEPPKGWRGMFARTRDFVNDSSGKMRNYVVEEIIKPFMYGFQYILFLDDDDLFDSYAFDYIRNYMHEFPNRDIYQVTQTGNSKLLLEPLSTKPYYEINKKNRATVLPSNLTFIERLDPSPKEYVILPPISFCCWNMIIKREHLIKCFKEGLDYCYIPNCINDGFNNLVKVVASESTVFIPVENHYIRRNRNYTDAVTSNYDLTKIPLLIDFNNNLLKVIETRYPKQTKYYRELLKNELNTNIMYMVYKNSIQPYVK